jgi:hypothetical protein
MRITITIFLFAIFITSIYSETISTKEINIQTVRTNEPMHTDGDLTEAVWQRPGFKGLLQDEPDQFRAPSQQSEVWFAYDDEAIYFAAKYSDTCPDSIMARLVRRDFIWGDPSDGCVLYLDPYHDHRNGYFFYVSAAGTLADGIIENDVKQPNDLTWDAVWEGVSHLDPDGWTIEMKIPFSQLRFQEASSQVWGVDVERFISRRSETDMIAFTPRNESGFTSRFPNLVGLENITPPARIEVLPYVTGRTERIGTDVHDPFNRMERYVPSAGIDLKAGLGSSLSLNGTINPDFCQVELDPASVNLTDVETIYEEKRPFFTEGVGIFRFGQGGANDSYTFNWTDPNIFYSRRIGRSPQRPISGNDPSINYYVDVPGSTRILGAGKISGALGDDWKVGMVHALTKREHADINDNGRRSELEIEPMTYYGVARAQRDFNTGEQGIGVLTTYTGRIYDDNALREYLNSDALVFAADGWTFLDKERTYVFTGWAATSRVSGNADRMIALQRSSGHYFQRPDASYLGVDSSMTSLSGYAGRFIVNKNRGRWVFNTTVGFISPKFEINDLGSCAFSDLINAHVFTGYRWNTPTEYYLNTGISAAAYVNYDFGGNKIGQGLWSQAFINLPSFYGGSVSLTYNPETYNARLTRGGPLTLNPASGQISANFYTDFRDWWVVTLYGLVKTGDALVTRTINASLELKASTTLTLSIAPSFTKEINYAQYYTVVTDPLAVETFGKRYLFARLDRNTLSTDFRADWIMTPKLSFQVYIQPYITTGKYTDYKSLARPKSFQFTPYAFSENRDFNYIAFQGNAVLRWEYLPGSTLYLVWTQSRADDQYLGDFQFGDSMDRMFQTKPDNIIMLKLSYWFGM